jgi:hypothetical protein
MSLAVEAVCVFVHRYWPLFVEDQVWPPVIGRSVDRVTERLAEYEPARRRNLFLTGRRTDA